VIEDKMEECSETGNEKENEDDKGGTDTVNEKKVERFPLFRPKFEESRLRRVPTGQVFRIVH
jgi:hypothetical protein